MNDRFRFRCFDNDIQKFVVGFRLCDDYNWPNGITEQCTGLKDKNGKLIYEGDIVRVAQLSTNLPVVYDLKFATFELLSYKYCVSLHGSDEDLEVIGNIHENPELLEDTTNCSQLNKVVTNCNQLEVNK